MYTLDTELQKTLARHEALHSIETSFPIEKISQLAQHESWRKEIFRPIYHIHKWWANRLGSVFRAIILSAVSDANQDIWSEFYNTHNFSDKVVLDPFMGSGTTLGEAAKLGAKAIGCDINPISTFAVTQAFSRVEVKDLVHFLQFIEGQVKDKICKYYVTLDPETGAEIPVLYYFWVKEVDTPTGESVPLFNSYVFSKNAYPKRKPEAKIVCPKCWKVIDGIYNAKTLICAYCRLQFNPQQGRTDGRFVIDSQGNRFEIKSLLPKDGIPFRHRLYAIMAVRQNGEKVYLSPQKFDFELLKVVRNDLLANSLPLPVMEVRPGYNTNQARGYNYLYWRDFFNDRQLLCLGLLLKTILQIENREVREQFLCLFSTTLEFNNLFCSFKGEGTGAVRPLFSHHILKPERTPLENNVWGLPQSSGSFSKLFKSKLLKAKEYLDRPTELQLSQKETTRAKEFIASNPIKLSITDSWEDFRNQPESILILNGDSATLPIPDKMIDAIVTDPPYFDFVHYSELSDFFYAWLAPILCKDYPYFSGSTSQYAGEVQNKNSTVFATNLTRVFRESYRVLKDEGVLVFSFHHSKPQGWAAIYQAIHDSQFKVVAAYPVYAEMLGASPKSSTKEPISLDIILVCKKHGFDSILDAKKSFVEKELASININLSQTDRFNIEAGFLLIKATTKKITAEDLNHQLFQLRV